MRSAAVATGCLALLVLAACGSGSGGSTAPTSGSSGHSGTVDVLSAGSLLAVVQKALAPGFHEATGDNVSNYSAGSDDLVAAIKGKVKQGDVFISASPATDTELEGSAHGGWVSWYATFATSPLVLGYNPRSSFASALRSEPWYDVIARHGLRIGLTPPASDPKGALAVQALDATAKTHHAPALRSIGTTATNQFPETSLAAEVASGQLDAGFFYLAEANAAGIPTVPLTGVHLKATYTVTVLNGAPHAAAADAFVKYLLSSAGQADLKRYGFTLVTPPATIGSGVPASLRASLH
jgi:molybdate/tungstate transport system substrate-binding protein